jgi:hypothetical protein
VAPVPQRCCGVASRLINRVRRSGVRQPADRYDPPNNCCHNSCFSASGEASFAGGWEPLCARAGVAASVYIAGATYATVLTNDRRVWSDPSDFVMIVLRVVGPLRPFPAHPLSNPEAADLCPRPFKLLGFSGRCNRWTRRRSENAACEETFFNARAHWRG